MSPNAEMSAADKILQKLKQTTRKNYQIKKKSVDFFKEQLQQIKPA